MIIRKGKNEMKAIIDVANQAFIPVRNPQYDFRKTVPKVYQSKEDMSFIHYVATSNDKIISVGGNLLQSLTINDKTYNYGIVGTVSTLPAYQKKGAMKRIMAAIETENRELDLDFSMLTGIRKRYNFLGYEKSGFRYCYEFNNYFVERCVVLSSIIIKPFENNQLDVLFNLYLNTQPIKRRTKDELVLGLKGGDSLLYLIYKDSIAIGYFSFCHSKNLIIELGTVNLKVVPELIKSIMDYFSLNDFRLEVNPLNRDLVLELDKFCEEKNIIEIIHFKVYNMIRFIEMVISLNMVVRDFPDLEEIFSIENENILIRIKNQKLTICLTDKKNEKVFTKQEFVRYMFSTDSLYNRSKLLPLFIDFSKPDLF